MLSLEAYFIAAGFHGVVCLFRFILTQIPVRVKVNFMTSFSISDRIDHSDAF